MAMMMVPGTPVLRLRRIVHHGGRLDDHRCWIDMNRRCLNMTVAMAMLGVSVLRCHHHRRPLHMRRRVPHMPPWHLKPDREHQVPGPCRRCSRQGGDRDQNASAGRHKRRNQFHGNAP